jgi:hypothetical protein
VRRGPAPEARALYRVLDYPARRAPSLAADEAAGFLKIMD